MIDTRGQDLDIYDSLNYLYTHASGIVSAKQLPNDLIPEFYTNAFPSEGVLSNRQFILPVQVKRETWSTN